MKIFYQDILQQLRVTIKKTEFVEREYSQIRSVTVFVIDSLQLFPYSCLQQQTFLKIANNGIGFA